MRLEGEAIALCSRVPEVEWSVGLWLGHFCGHSEQPHSYRDCPHQEQGGLDWKRISQEPEGCNSVDGQVCDHHDVGCEEQGRLREFEDEEPPICKDFLRSSPLMMANPLKLTVGYALTAKKTKSFMQPVLIAHARSKGITFAPIDHNRPLGEQGPFDVILHKVTTEGWHQQLKVTSGRFLAYQQGYPEVMILDPPEAINNVCNRQSMLQQVAALNFRHPRGKVGVPKQLVVDDDSDFISDRVSRAGLKFPLVAKPKLVDGTAKSHALSLAFNKICLSELTLPVVLQEFINHGGVLFKVYVIGHVVKVVRRFSLPDISEEEARWNGIMPFPRVSSAAASADGADLDPNVAELPSMEMLESFSRELRCRLGLSLFNLDMIRAGGRGSCFYVIDINYFPGYGKMPEYEKLFAEFLCSLAQTKHTKSII